MTTFQHIQHLPRPERRSLTAGPSTTTSHPASLLGRIIRTLAQWNPIVSRRAGRRAMIDGYEQAAARFFLEADRDLASDAPDSSRDFYQNYVAGVRCLEHAEALRDAFGEP